MRPYLVPIIGAALLVIGVLMVLTNSALAVPALVLEIVGVLLLGFYIVRGIWSGRPRR